MPKLIVGCGYLGRRVAELWKATNDTVYVITRSSYRAAELRDEGLEPIVADVTQPATLRQLPEADVLLFAVGYDRTAEPSIHEVYAGGVANLVAGLPWLPERFIYISSTGVYGNGRGEWVDERTPANPSRDGGKASLAAEDILRHSPFADRLVALRLGGIYGPGRIPYLDKLQSGEPIPALAAGWLNLIHVSDAAKIVVQIAKRLELPCPLTFNVTDGNPVRRGDYYQTVANLLGAPPPTFVPPEPGSPRAARATANRRISNQRLRNSLACALEFPSAAEGLAAILGKAGTRSRSAPGS